MCVCVFICVISPFTDFFSLVEIFGFHLVFQGTREHTTLFYPKGQKRYGPHLRFPVLLWKREGLPLPRTMQKLFLSPSSWSHSFLFMFLIRDTVKEIYFKHLVSDV